MDGKFLEQTWTQSVRQKLIKTKIQMALSRSLSFRQFLTIILTSSDSKIFDGWYDDIQNIYGVSQKFGDAMAGNGIPKIRTFGMEYDALEIALKILVTIEY